MSNTVNETIFVFSRKAKNKIETQGLQPAGHIWPANSFCK